MTCNCKTMSDVGVGKLTYTLNEFLRMPKIKFCPWCAEMIDYPDDR